LPNTIARFKPSVLLVGIYKATGSQRFRPRGTGFVVENGLMLATDARLLLLAGRGDGPTAAMQRRRASGERRMRSVTVLYT